MGNSQAIIHGTEVDVLSCFKGSAPITKQALNFIKRNSAGSTILEIGCGCGIYARLLREKGVEVIATDACRINKEGLPPPNNMMRMAEFTNSRAIPNMIELNAVDAVNKYGQDTNTSLFLSFPLPRSMDNSYDETALRNFKGNKFFLIALYDGLLSKTEEYNKDKASNVTGSLGFHAYLAEAWNIKDKKLLEEGRMHPDSTCYLIYFERKTMSGGTNRKCPKNNAKDFKLKTVNIGLDGNLWIVSKRSDGVKFWKRK